MEDCSMCCQLIISLVALIVAITTMIVNFKMLHVMKKDITEAIMNMQNRFDNSLERAKQRLIYEKYFTSNGKPGNFEDLVKKAYDDIYKLIPFTCDDYQQEDHLLAEWLIVYRDYDTDTNVIEPKRICKLADEIHKIRIGR